MDELYPPIPDGQVIAFARELRDRDGYLALPYVAMRKLGAAVRTLAAVVDLAGAAGQTFASVYTIAERAALPAKTVRNHLELLVRQKWLAKSAPRGRRTCTYALTFDRNELRQASNFATLPRWWKDHRYPAAALVYATIVAELCKLETTTENYVPNGEDHDGLPDGYLDHLGQISLTKLETMTG